MDYEGLSFGGDGLGIEPLVAAYGNEDQWLLTLAARVPALVAVGDDLVLPLSAVLSCIIVSLRLDDEVEFLKFHKYVRLNV